MSSLQPFTSRHFGTIALLSALLVAGGCTLADDDADPNATRDNLGSERGPDDNPNPRNANGSSGDRCAIDALPSPASVSTNPCGEGETVLAESVKRAAGEPEVSTRTFELEGASEICVTVRDKGTHPDQPTSSEPSENANGGNGDNSGSNAGKGNGDDRDDNRNDGASDDNASPNQGNAAVTAAWVSVDGNKVVGPDAFARRGDTLRETLEVDAGQHEVELRVAARPGSSAELEVKATDGAPSDRTAVGERGLLEVENVAVDHPLFSPNGDGYHDTITFNADNEWRRFPGSEADGFSYSLEWDWQIRSADTCDTVDAGLSGTSKLDSTANVRLTWDGTTQAGRTAPDGNYVYQYRAKLVRSDGKVVDAVETRPRGFVLDTSSPDFDPSGSASLCDPNNDPHGCKCPANTPDGTRCTFAWIPHLETFDRPALVHTNAFLSSHQTKSGRWEVVVDLRSFNGGGLVPQTNGTWTSVDALQQYVSKLTGVPPDPNDVRLFNFDYTQLGYSHPVVRKQGLQPGFNHFLLDVITDADGRITIDGQTVDLKEAFASDSTDVPPRFELASQRRGEECGYNGNTDGEHDVRATSCTRLQTANLDPEGTDLGIYVFEKQIFDFRIDDLGMDWDEHCVVNGIFKCGVRTMQRNADMTFRSRQYGSDDGDIQTIRELVSRSGDVPALVGHTDRHFEFDGGGTSSIDGICSNDSSSAGALSIPLDSGAGALPGTCVVNGIF